MQDAKDGDSDYDDDSTDNDDGRGDISIMTSLAPVLPRMTSQ